MPFQFSTINGASKSTFFFFFPILVVVSLFLIVLSHGSIAAADETAKIGAIVDLSSRIGKEQKVAIEIAVQNFNDSSTNQKLALRFKDHGGDPLQAAYAAEELIKEEQVQVIVGMETWHETALVAEVGNRAQVPVLSLAAGAFTPPLAALRWPFLVQIATNGTEQVHCTAAILRTFMRRRIITIHEDDMFGGGMLALLSREIQSFGSEIEHSLVFPPFYSLSDPKGFVQEELTKVLLKKSRVFVVLQSSLSLATNLFREAKQLGLVGRDSVWIITDTVSSLLDSVNTSVISSMQGALGIDQAYFPENSKSFPDFKGKFLRLFRENYPEEDNSEPSIHALRAYDSITLVSQALQKLGSYNRTQKQLLDDILSSNFTGLSGDIRFSGEEASASALPTFRIVNVIGRKYNELGFWSSELGFTEENGAGNGSASMEAWTESVIWPGKQRDVPTEGARMRIVVPGNASFEKFVKVERGGVSDEDYTGFCIDVFREALKVVQRGQSYNLTYTFYAVNDTYDALVESVVNKSYDAVVGDITVLANRSKFIEFTQPYAESGLSMVVPAKGEEAQAWMFLKPFTKEMWSVTAVLMIYTMMVVWFLEHQSNEDFRGPWKDQISTTLWFTFCSLFFAHREKLQGNYTKVVVAVWLFVVFVVTSSYTASLSSMLTVPRLLPSVTDIERLRSNNAPVGCDGDSFVKDYLKNVLDFKNIVAVGYEKNYPDQFKSGAITAAFLELPYEKVFLKDYCNEYTATGPVYSFGGFAFGFQKDSPMASDFSEAILTIGENGILKKLEDKWFNQQSSCLNSTADVDSLKLQSFWGLYLISGATSTICFLIFFARVVKNYRDSRLENQGVITPSRKCLWNRIVRFARYFYVGGSIRSPEKTPSISRTKSAEVWGSCLSSWELVSPSEEDSERHLQGPRPPEIEIPIRGE